MRNKTTLINFLNQFNNLSDSDYNYYLHFTIPKKEGTHVIKFNQCKEVDEGLYLIQYYEWDQKQHNIANFTGHQIHLWGKQVIDITTRPKSDYYPNYVIN